MDKLLLKEKKRESGREGRGLLVYIYNENLQAEPWLYVSPCIRDSKLNFAGWSDISEHFHSFSRVLAFSSVACISRIGNRHFSGLIPKTPSVYEFRDRIAWQCEPETRCNPTIHANPANHHCDDFQISRHRETVSRFMYSTFFFMVTAALELHTCKKLMKIEDSFDYVNITNSSERHRMHLVFDDATIRS